MKILYLVSYRPINDSDRSPYPAGNGRYLWSYLNEEDAKLKAEKTSKTNGYTFVYSQEVDTATSTAIGAPKILIEYGNADEEKVSKKFEIAEPIDIKLAVNQYYSNLPNIEIIKQKSNLIKNNISTGDISSLFGLLDDIFLNKYNYQDLANLKGVSEELKEFLIKNPDQSGRLYLPNISEITIDADHLFFRGRKYNEKFYPEVINNSDLWAPPVDRAQLYRVNKNKESMLYVSEKASLIPKEIHLKPDNEFLLIIYTLRQCSTFLEVDYNQTHLKDIIESKENIAKFEVIIDLQRYLFSQTDNEKNQYELSTSILNYFLTKDLATNYYNHIALTYKSLRAKDERCFAFLGDPSLALDVLLTLSCQYKKNSSIKVTKVESTTNMDCSVETAQEFINNYS